ncbi:MAG: VacJ family lipoprotein [Steroidobacteraceae bacterium]
MRGALASAMMGLTLCGCASRSLDMRALPPDTPAADNAAAIEYAAALTAAAPSEGAEPGTQESGEVLPPLTAADAPSVDTYDPWERLNRYTYRFNAHFDEALFLPVANAYRRLPSPIRSGVHNFLNNLAEIDSVVNYALQWRLRYGACSLGRLALNSTIGIGGLLDVARKLHLPSRPTGFSATLSTWGMHPGPYLVIPFLGPSTLRDGVGLLGDYGTNYGINPAGFYRGEGSWLLGGAEAIDDRANVSFRYYSSGSPFEYEQIRFLYVRKRLIEDAGLHRHSAPQQPRSNTPAGK